jgi:hypothetical protein
MVSLAEEHTDYSSSIIFILSLVSGLFIKVEKKVKYIHQRSLFLIIHRAEKSLLLENRFQQIMHARLLLLLLFLLVLIHLNLWHKHLSRLIKHIGKSRHARE